MVHFSRFRTRIVKVAGDAPYNLTTTTTVRPTIIALGTSTPNRYLNQINSLHIAIMTINQLGFLFGSRPVTSVTRFGDLLDFGQLFKAFGDS